MKITNGVQWLDTAGNVISAHGGFLQKDGYFSGSEKIVTARNLYHAIVRGTW